MNVKKPPKGRYLSRKDRDYAKLSGAVRGAADGETDDEDDALGHVHVGREDVADFTTMTPEERAAFVYEPMAKPIRKTIPLMLANRAPHRALERGIWFCTSLGIRLRTGMAVPKPIQRP